LTMGFEVTRIRGGHSQIVGYARVSTRDQSLASQMAALKAAGCCRIYSERVSAIGYREGWAAVMDTIRPGDTVAVVRLDRIGRRLNEVIGCCHEIAELGAYVRSIAQSIDTRSAAGKVILPIWAALAETERAILIERTNAGLEAARAAGRTFGRPPKRTPAKDKLIAHLRAQGFSFEAIAREVGVGATTVRRAVAAMELKPDPRQLRLDVGATKAAQSQRKEIPPPLLSGASK
jgi:DNA invertase Pin-like site-specific DNA recombinase